LKSLFQPEALTFGFLILSVMKKQFSMYLRSLLIIISAVGCINSFSDVLPEGKKKVSFSFEVTNIDAHPNYIFIAYPVNTSGGKPELESVILQNSTPVRMECRFGVPTLYAIKKDKFNAADIDVTGITSDSERDKKLSDYFKTNTDLIHSAKVSCNNYVDKDEKYSAMLRQYKVESITADTMMMGIEKVKYKDSDGNVIEEKAPGEKSDVVDPVGSSASMLYYAIPILAVVAIATIVIIRRMKKQ
jgi:hypothetical protein